MKSRAPTIYNVAKKAGAESLHSFPGVEQFTTHRKSPTKVMTLCGGSVRFKAEASITSSQARWKHRRCASVFHLALLRAADAWCGSGSQRLRVRACGYSVRDRSQLNGYLNVLPLWRRLDGLILMSMPLDAKRTAHLQTHGMEVVCMEFGNTHFCSIEVDNLEGEKWRPVTSSREDVDGSRSSARLVFLIISFTSAIFAFRDMSRALRAAGIDLPEAYISRPAVQPRRSRRAGERNPRP